MTRNRIYSISLVNTISFWDESNHPLLILERGIRKLVFKLSVSSSFQDMDTSNICWGDM